MHPWFPGELLYWRWCEGVRRGNCLGIQIREREKGQAWICHGSDDGNRFRLTRPQEKGFCFQRNPTHLPR